MEEMHREQGFHVLSEPLYWNLSESLPFGVLWRLITQQ